MRSRGGWTRSGFAVVLGAVLLSCASVRPSPTPELDAAAERADGSRDARGLALAGFHALLVANKPEQAKARFAKALTLEKSEPYALVGKLLMERREHHPEAALATALDLCERAPTHPLATLGARYVLELAAVSTALDQFILQRAEALLAAGVRGDTAHLLRSAVATIQGNRLEDKAQAATLLAMGVVTRGTLVGPLSAYRFLELDEVLPPEKDGVLAGPLEGPLGKMPLREVHFPEGRFSLQPEPPRADVYLLATDVEVPASGVHVIRTVGSVTHKLYLDGALLMSRRDFARATPSVTQVALELSAGRHRLLLKVLRDDRNPVLAISMMRADGRPANLTFSPAKGRPARWDARLSVDRGAGYSTARALFEATRPEAGDALARYLAAFDARSRDRDGAKQLVSELTSALRTPATARLAAEVALGDRTVPPKVARGRATRDLEATTTDDRGHVDALVASAELALEDGRLLEATELLKQARSAFQPVGYPVHLVQARVELALGVDAQAEQSAIAALEAVPGVCDALEIRYDLARRRDAIALSDRLVADLKGCPGALDRMAEHAKWRGDVTAAATLFARSAQRDPANLSAAIAVANAYVSLKRYPQAVKVLSDLRAVWPRQPALLKRLADIAELSGNKEEALSLREQALTLDGGDLSLRRSVERARTGKELLSDHAIDGKAAIASYEASPGSQEATSTFVLDAAAVRAFPDGSTVDRIHIIQKALDQSGVSDVAEVTLPSGAQVLSMRTVKKDGSVLEPETFEGKDSISLPGVQVGDYVEYEYLEAHPARGPAQPGFSAASFYFQIARASNHWSTYTVVGPKGLGLAVDAHNMKAPAPVVQGNEEVFRHEERNVPPFVPEPNSPPSANEYLPFVTVGAGASGNLGIVSAYADAYLGNGQLTFEVERFARAAAGGKRGLEAVQAVHARVMDTLSGTDVGLAQSAASSLAQERGSRLWVLKSSLEALGIPARLVAVRTYAVDPAAYRFPNEQLLPYICLRVTVPDGKRDREVWLDPLIRYGPFGALPEQAMGGQEAYLLPEPGRPLERVRTPTLADRPPKSVQLKLKLREDGALEGSGEETYRHFEAAQLAESLEALPPDQRRQALQSALSRYFGGAELSDVQLALKREVGAELKVAYRFVARGFARAEGGGRWVLPPVVFPSQLGRRYVQVGARRTPLYVDSTEKTHTVAELELPAGAVVVSPVPEIKTTSKYGQFVRRERVTGQKLVIEEDFQLEMARIPPSAYDEFGHFAGEVDLAQSRDLVVERK